jgi:hypothetical protein
MPVSGFCLLYLYVIPLGFKMGGGHFFPIYMSPLRGSSQANLRFIKMKGCFIKTLYLLFSLIFDLLNKGRFSPDQ